MNKTWLCADWHLGETRMSLMMRPHKDANDMLWHFVDMHNSRVSPNDTVIVVGDAVFRDADPKTLSSIELFTGRKTLIRGNHDEAFTDDQLKPYFERIIPHGHGLELEVGGIPCFATHYPILGRKDRFNLVGHVHGAWKFQLNALNVGVDANHFRPYSLDEIPGIFEAINKHYDNDVWAGYFESNAQFVGKRGKEGSYWKG